MSCNIKYHAKTADKVNFIYNRLCQISQLGVQLSIFKYTTFFDMPCIVISLVSELHKTRQSLLMREGVNRVIPNPIPMFLIKYSQSHTK